MKTLYIASTSTYAGKSLAAIAVALYLKDKNLKVGYLKPLGDLQVRTEKQLSDEDALYIAEQIGLKAAKKDLCPVVVNSDLTQKACADKLESLEEKILASFKRIATGKDVMIAGGFGDLSRGALLKLSAPKVANLLDARVLLVTRYEDDSSIEDVLVTPALLGDRLLGVIFNCAAGDHQQYLTEQIGPCLERRGINFLGAIPEDDVLRAISIGELAVGLGAKILSGEKQQGRLVKHFLVGAMGPQSAAKYLQKTEDKVVVTGGDRPDIQLAALQTSTCGLLLTGGLHPSEVILKRARELDIPVLLVGSDTFSVVEAVEKLKGRLRVRGEAKIQRARELFSEYVDMPRLHELLMDKKKKAK